MKVSKDNPPRIAVGAYWERSERHSSYGRFRNRTIARYPSKKEGWSLINWSEEVVGFVNDGLEVPEHNQEFDFKIGFCGKLCAFPKQNGIYRKT